MSNRVESVEELNQRVDRLERQLESTQRWRRGVRKRSSITLLGLPLYDIASGPDPENDEVRGHARGVIAIGDVATGVLAIGGFARGAIAIGGAAVGLLSIGGCAIGLLAALGGFAAGGVAGGGMAIGGVAAGGSAIGYYATGGDARGEFVVCPARRDPEAVEFFHKYLPRLLD
jgi:hypothetical protein